MLKAQPDLHWQTDILGYEKITCCHTTKPLKTKYGCHYVDCALELFTLSGRTWDSTIINSVTSTVRRCDHTSRVSFTYLCTWHLKWLNLNDNASTYSTLWPSQKMKYTHWPTVESQSIDFSTFYCVVFIGLKTQFFQYTCWEQHTTTCIMISRCGQSLDTNKS